MTTTPVSSQAALIALIEHTLDAIWSVDRCYRLIVHNSACQQQFVQAYGVELRPELNLVTALPTPQRSLWQAYYDRALAGERFSVELHFDLPTLPNDIEIWFNPIWEQQQITGVAMFGRDVSDRKRVRRELQEAKDQLRAVVDAVPGCVSWFSADRRYLGINRYLANTFKLRPEDFIGKELGFMEASPSFASFVHQFLASPVESSTVEIAAQVDGAMRSYLLAAQKYAQNQAAVFVGLDITDRKQFEEALRESQERYALAVNGANDGLWDWNLRTNHVYYSPRWKAMLGYEEPEIGNRPEDWFDRVHPDEAEWLEVQLKAHLEGRTQHFEIEHRMRHQDGSYRWMLSRGYAVRDGQTAYRMAGSQTDITDRKQAEHQLLHHALHDNLTGLANRALFMDRLQQAIGRYKRLPDYKFAVLFIDLDRFKILNDSLGHIVGDQLLMTIARRLESCLRSVDTIARLGGDEFTILLEGIHDADDACHLSERIHQALQTPFNLDGQEVFTSASIGIALSEAEYDRPEDLLRNADTAMYRAKTLGRARHALFDAAMHKRAVALLQLETDLRRAVAISSSPLQPQEFRIQYQPIVRLETGEISGFEALVRWQHPERGLISPLEFIPLAEDTGLIVPLGQWILSEAYQQLQQWQQQFWPMPLSISVNLSTKQFAQPNLIEQIRQLLHCAQLQHPQMQTGQVSLKLEITESAIMDNSEAAQLMLEQLKALGVQLLIDDFGTGYSSLSYLHRFPIDTVKIDQSFISHMSTDSESAEIVRAIVSLAHNLGMNVIAEGIELADQLRQLRSLGTEYGQGFFFAKPLERQEVEALMQNQPVWLARF